MKAATRILAVLATAATIFPAGCGTVSPMGSPAREASGIRGRVTLQSTGQPVAGAHVYAYKDHSKNLIGVADYVSKGSGEDGTFTLGLPPGEYYLVSRRRSSGANYGPIVKGDLYD
ncbi:MAG: carboxypeptidase regulatory-like domain-containing protein, partial [bacterium]